jgi:hypothetical protein
MRTHTSGFATILTALPHGAPACARMASSRRSIGRTYPETAFATMRFAGEVHALLQDIGNLPQFLPMLNIAE